MATSRSGALALLLAVILACSACGGGGSGGDASPVSAAPPLVLVRWSESAGATGYHVHWGTASSVWRCVAASASG